MHVGQAMTREEMEVDDLVVLSAYAKERGIATNHQNDFAFVERFSRDGFPVIRWGGQRSTSLYHPSFLSKIGAAREFHFTRIAAREAKT